MVIAVKVLNTKTMETYNYQSIAHAKHVIIPLSARTGYTFKVFRADNGEHKGNIRPNPHQYKTGNNPRGKMTARYISND